MSHEVKQMAYSGEVPWHGLGNRLTDGASVDTWITESGMDWEIDRTAVEYVYGDEHRVFAGRDVLHRSDTGDALGVVSKRYHVVQPREVVEFYRQLVEAGNLTMETAGVLRNGAIYWALAKNTAAEIKLTERDVISPYVLLSTACDGTMATRAMPTTVRVVCANTLRLSLRDQDAGVSISHLAKFDADAVRAQLGLDSGAVEAFGAMADSLASQSMSDAQAFEFFTGLKKDVLLNKTREKRLAQAGIPPRPRKDYIVERMMECFKDGPGADLSTSRNTRFGALNAVTHYVDHTATARSVESRFKSAQFGRGATLKDRARELLTAA